MRSASKTLNKYALSLLWAACATPPAPTPPLAAPVNATTAQPSLLVHRNVPGSAPQLCLARLADASLECDPTAGLFAGTANVKTGDFPAILVEEGGSGHRERLVRWRATDQAAVPLTPWTGRVRDPVWSADGASLFMTSDAEGGSDLFVVDAGGRGAPRPLSPHPAGSFEPSPHPDGERLLFASSRDGNAELYLVNTESPGALTRLTHDAADDMHPRWSPDGSRLAFISNRGELQRIWTLVPGGEPRALAPSLTDAQVDFAWANAGSRLAIVVGPSPDRTRIVIADGHSGAVIAEIAESGLAVQQPAWSTADDQLAFTCQRAGELPKVCVSDAVGGGLRVVAEQSGHEVWLPRWVP